MKTLVGRGAWWATVHGIAESDTTEQLSIAHSTEDLMGSVSMFPDQMED